MVGLRVQKRVSKRVQRCDQTAMNPKDLPQAWREQADVYERDSVHAAKATLST